MLGGIELAFVGLAAVLDDGIEGEAEVAGRREDARATVAVEVGEIGERDVRLDDDFFLGAQIGLARGMDVEHQDHRGGTRQFELNVEADLDEHAAARVAQAARNGGETACVGRLLRYFPRSFMAKTSWINRNNRKRATVKKYAALRAELKAKKDYMGLSQLPRDASPTRVVNRCEVTGRRRAFIRRFKISRLTFRELASNGFIPGVTKSSW